VWLLLLALLAVACVAATAGFVYLASQGTREARELGPWPGPDVAAAEVATVDLTPLGLHLSGRREADEVYGPKASFTDGAVIEYQGAGNVRVIVAALRYATPSDASDDFMVLQDWAQGTCGWHVSGYLGSAGVIRCGYSDAHKRILWTDNWILDITATAGGGLAPAELADKVRDAAAAHWHRLAKPHGGAEALRGDGYPCDAGVLAWWDTPRRHRPA
jgi:hypothetical protein